MVATGKLHVVNVKTSEMVTHRLEVENVMDKTEVLFDLGMAGIVPIDQARAIDVAKKKLVIGFDRQFFETLAGAGVYPEDLDFRKAFTLRFVNKKVGMKP